MHKTMLARLGIAAGFVAIASLHVPAASGATPSMAEKKPHMTTRMPDGGEKPLDLTDKVGNTRTGTMPREPGELQRKALGDWNKWDPMKGF